MRPEWRTEQLEIVNGGVNSAVDPRLIGNNQAAWAMNMVMRGGNPHTRPSFKYCMDLPSGLFQGAGYFSIQDGMIVASIAGNLYRIRIGEDTFSSEQITLGFSNSATKKKAWFCQTVETLIIQDGESYPIFYDGNTARRSDVTGIETYNELYNPDASDADNDANLIPQVPIGRQMAYGNGRLWVAQGGFNLVAGDIRTDKVGSELLFSETQYLTGGGALYFAGGINGLGFIPTTGGGDTGALVVFGKESSDTVRADISNRDQWQFIPGFVSPAFRGIGSAGQECILPVNQDLYWRDQFGEVRSLRNAASSEAGPGSAPLSREVSRIVDHESDKYVSYSSSILADNRMLFTGNPFLLGNGGVGFKTIASLDFANISTMQGKTPPAYDGMWSGLNFVQLLSGKFSGKQRNFIVSYHEDEVYRLWEIGNSRNDITEIDDAHAQSPIVSYIEYGRKAFGDIRQKKRLERFDLYLSEIDGPVTASVYWRADNNEKWQLWDESVAVCAKTTDASTTTPHIWKILKPQQRPQLKTYTIPTRYNSVTGFQEHVGFEFQFRIKITGRCRIYRALAHAEVIPQTPYNDDVISTCVEVDTTSNGIDYTLMAKAVAPTIIDEPDSYMVNVGAPASVSVLGAGTGANIIQWYRGASGDVSSPIIGATKNLLSIASIPFDSQFWARVGSRLSFVDSITAVISIPFFSEFCSTSIGLIGAELRSITADKTRNINAVSSFALSGAVLNAAIDDIIVESKKAVSTFILNNSVLRTVMVDAPCITSNSVATFALNSSVLKTVIVEAPANNMYSTSTFSLTSATLA